MITKSDSLKASTGALASMGFAQPIKIIIADADTAFTKSISNYLTAQPGYNIVAKVDSCMDALIWCEELSPDILILDWHLMFEGLLPSEMKGIPFLKQVKALEKSPSVIIASRLNLDEHRYAALQAGADEFMLKSKFPQLIRPIITRLAPQN